MHTYYQLVSISLSCLPLKHNRRERISIYLRNKKRQKIQNALNKFANLNFEGKKQF